MPQDLIEQPSGDKSHEQNVQLSVSSILGRKVSKRKVKKSAEDLRKESFCTIISALQKVNNRELLLKIDLDIDLTTYNDDYHTAIDGLLSMLYTPNQVELIDYYLYEEDRFNEEGLALGIPLPDGTVAPMETPSDLYAFIKNIK